VKVLESDYINAALVLGKNSAGLRILKALRKKKKNKIL
jgi:hypothetical protein